MAAGPRVAARSIWLPILLLAPTWLRNEATSVTLDLRTAAGFGVLLGLFFGPQRPTFKLLLIDGLMLALVGVRTASLLANGQLLMLTFPEILRQWLLPYIVGRFILANSSDLTALGKAAVLAVTIASIYAIVEAITKVNIINKALGMSFTLLEEAEGYRWGLKRAQGPTEHPIFYGMLLTLMLPPVLFAARDSLRRGASKKPLAALLLLLTGIVVTVSRGAQIAGFAVVYLVAALGSRRWRVPLIALTLVAAVGVWAGKDALMPILASLGKSSKEEEPDYKTIYVIQGKEYEYTGELHRFLLFKVYEDDLAQAGLLGYGDSLAPIIQSKPEDIAQMFASFDNHYVEFYLKYGKLGVGLFLGLTAAVLWSSLRLAWNVDDYRAPLAAGCFAAILAVSVDMATVTFAPDFSAAWFFIAGLTANLQALPPLRSPQIAFAAPQKALPAGGLNLLRPQRTK